MANPSRADLRVIRHRRVRKKISGTAARPRLSVYRSLKHISAQIIDDTNGVTLAAASSVEKGLKTTGTATGARKVGEELAKRAKQAGITEVIFDRAGFKYHGRVAELAAGAREGGLNF